MMKVWFTVMTNVGAYETSDHLVMLPAVPDMVSLHGHLHAPHPSHESVIETSIVTVMY